MAAYGYESAQVWVAVVSLTGRIWMSFQSRRLSPVGQQLEILKLSHPKAFFAPQAEYGNRHPRPLPGVYGQPDKTVVHQRVSVRPGGIAQDAVDAILIADKVILLSVKNTVFVGEWERLAAQIQFYAQIILVRQADSVKPAFGCSNFPAPRHRRADKESDPGRAVAP